MTHRPRHRHFVAFPLFVAILGIALAAASHTSSALTASVSAGQAVLSLPDGAQMLPGADSVLDTTSATAFLRQGAALIRTESIVQIRTPSCDILAIAGAFHLVAGETATTVSAVTAPVLVSVAGERTIVPVGRQFRVSKPLAGLEAGFAAWRSAREGAPLPEHFLREQVLALQQFPDIGDALPKAASLFPSDESHSALELPAAQERSQEAWRLSVLGALRWRIERQDEEGARAILARPAFHAALADARSFFSLVTLAGRADDGAAELRPLLLHFLADRHDLWLLTALHPVFHTGAWAAGVPALTQEEQALLAFGLPEADRSSQGLSPVVVRWWEQAVTGYIAEEQNPLAFVESLLTTLLPVVERDQQDGYPERAQTLLSALQSFAEPVAGRLSATLTLAMEKAKRNTVSSVDLFASPLSSSSSSSSISSSSSSSSLPPVDPHERVQTVTTALEQAGALFSLQTKVDPKQDGQSVAVCDILFSSPKGDLPYTFDVDVRTMQVSSIVQNGKLLPYPMEMDAFLKWVRE
ncbi:MAG: hypothetical protein PHX87_06655 [Candidatus Peribacteraceae bacterium]|nr:hypothetical protein [Candidatus Peribacteraceae bacterium]